MAKYDFKVRVCMGCRCNGAGVYESGKGSVELNDEDVQQLVALMQERNTSDSYELELEDTLSEIYAKLSDAEGAVAYRVNALHWMKGARSGCDYDEEELIDYCRANCGYSERGYDEEAESVEDHFWGWLTDYLQTADIETIQTIYLDYLYFDPEVFCMMDGAYDVTIPAKIVKMAELTNK